MTHHWTSSGIALHCALAAITSLAIAPAAAAAESANTWRAEAGPPPAFDAANNSSRRSNGRAGEREDCNGNGIDDAEDLAAWGTGFDDVASWAAFDAGDHGVGTDPDGYWSAVFDGRYVYFVPDDNGIAKHGEVLRYDTKEEFAAADSWATYDPGADGVGVDPDGFREGVFDGRFVYFVPADNGSGAHGEVLRYDTWGDFFQASSWAAFDAGAHGVGDDPDGYNGGAFDGRYVYFAPYDNGTVHHSEVLRYDTTGGFEEIASWATFDPRDYGVNEDYGYCGAVYDGHFVYFVPNCRSDTFHHGEVLRYDTTTDFFDPGSWAAFDPGENGVGTRPDGYVDGIFDGRYIYFVPCYKEVYGWHGEVMRYDTTGDFEEAGSWDTFDPGAWGVGVDPDGFLGGFFDGRFVHFVPCYNGSGFHGEMLRYDTQGLFDQADSWDTFDAGAHGVGEEGDGYVGGAFDGRYFYLAPGQWTGEHGEVMRYDTAAIGSPDCNGNGIPDECDIDDGEPDCNGNGVPDECDIAGGFSWDHDGDGVPDECQVDCNDNGIGDMEEVAAWGTLFDDPAAWTAFDPGENGVGDDPDGYHGGVFDGRYIYFVPYRAEYPHFTGEVMRYDTTGEFTDVSSWTTFDPGAHGVGSHPDGYADGVFDGRYLYLVPWADDSGYHGEVMRYDTTGEFTDVSSWTAYDPGAHGVGSDTDGYRGGLFDGRYVYFVPCYNGSAFHGQFLRLDPEKDFHSTDAWFAYDPGDHGVGNDPDGYSYAAFDGRYIYFGPYHNGTAYHGEVLRHDTAGDFWNASAWSAFDPGAQGVGSDPDGYPGVVFDGRYVYFVPFNNGTTYHGEVLRYDTAGAFDDVGSWATFDAAAEGIGEDPTGYCGAIFDGRFIIFVPMAQADGNHKEVLRYDTAASFEDPSSWTTYELPEEPLGYRSGGFDGQYVYLAPGGTYINHGLVQRYDIAAIGAPDCDENGVPDDCDLADGAPDCNENGIPDECDIAHGLSFDENENGIPDECEGSCPGDFDEDGDVDTADLLHLLGAWGTSGGDMDGDGDTDTADLLALLAVWGDCPSEPCPWDFNGDGYVDDLDLDILMAHWGDCPDPPEECPWDLNGDGTVDYQDYSEVVDHFGPCP
jgi:hypothetical protein